ncbi:DUF1176 domain-containing protein [Maritalea sp.]|uniref:DUF1176 domain-containing protein n=1 Tax=Maritalea sp. TaxID=2003361 RepID=UPI003EF76D11
MAPSAIADNFGEKRAYFKDWLAACRPQTNYCSAISYINPNPANGTVADYWFRIGRHKSGNHWEMSFTTVKTQPAKTTTFYIHVGEDFYPYTKGGTARAYGAINDIFLIGDQATAMLKKMIADDKMTIGFDDENAKSVDIEFSLSGLTAALLWIDDQQGRVGYPRIAGWLPVDLKLAEPQLDIPKELPPEILTTHAKNDNCDTMSDLVHGADWEVHQVNNTTLLYVIPCTAGAYNFGYSFYTQSTEYKGVTKLLFADYWAPMGWSGTDILINPYYDPENRALTSFYKGRGIGDCGNFGEWVWEDYGFKMNSFHAKEKCDGEPGDFPQIFPTPSK